jgi:hypothetical protein
MKRSIALFGPGCFLAGLALRPLASVMAQGKIQAEEDAKTWSKAVAAEIIPFPRGNSQEFRLGEVRKIGSPRSGLVLVKRLSRQALFDKRFN